LSAVLLLALAGCVQSDELSESATNASVLAGAGSYLGYSQAKALYQNSLVELGAPDVLYAIEVSAEQIEQYRRSVTRHGNADGIQPGEPLPALPSVMAYIGSRGAFHYFVYKPHFEGRSILKIRREDYPMAEVRPLSTSERDWLWVNPYWAMPEDVIRLGPIGADPLGNSDAGQGR
jgi:hypothetical protein